MGLLAMLFGCGNGEKNKGKSSLQQAQQLVQSMKQDEAIGILTTLLKESEGSFDPTFVPQAHGCLGQCYFETGQVEKALTEMQKALDLCKKNGDVEGVKAYLRNIFEIQRYLGMRAEAAVSAEQISANLSGAESNRFKKLATIVAAGEPPCRIAVSIGGEIKELDEINAPISGHMGFVWLRNRITLRPSESLTKKGDQLGAAGKFDEALAAFRAATKSDAFDPHPHYEEGLTLLSLKQYSEAIKAYEKTEELAPGWYNCRSDLWLAQQLADGKLSHEAFLQLRTLEDGQESPDQKISIANSLLAKQPALSLGYLFLGKQLKSLSRMKEAESAYRTGLVNAAEQNDVKTRLLLDLSTVVKSEDEKRQLLQQAINLNGNLTAAAMATVLLNQLKSPR